MAKISVLAVSEDSPKTIKLREEIEAAHSAVQEKAFQFSQQNDGRHRSACDNWLQAEKELLWAPECELVENDGSFHLRASLPGLEARQVQLMAMPDAMVIQAEQKRRRGLDGDRVHFSEFSANRVLRRISFPSPIDIGKVEAKLELGVLQVVALKRHSEFRKKEAVATQRPAVRRRVKAAAAGTAK